MRQLGLLVVVLHAVGGCGARPTPSAPSPVPAPVSAPTEVRCDAIHLEECAAACEAGSAAACRRLGDATYIGDGVRPDPQRAGELWERACRAGDGRACRQLGRAYTVTDTGFDEDFGRGAAYSERACELGDGLGCFRAAGSYEGDFAIRQDPPRAANLRARGQKLLQAACESGDGESCQDLGAVTGDGAWVERACAAGHAPGCLAWSDRLLHRDPDASGRAWARAGELWLEACNRGDGGACHDLGMLLENAGSDGEAAKAFASACRHGRGESCARLARSRARAETPEAMEEAVTLYDRGCAARDEDCCAELGAILADREPRDARRVVALYERACELGRERACFAAAQLRRADPDVRDPAAAARLYADSCERAWGDACTELADLVASGDGVPRDPERALAILEETCRVGWSSACMRLARFVDAGEGGARDPRRADELLLRACELDHADGCRALAERLESGSSPGGADRARALHYRACRGGGRESCLELARRYEDGSGVPADELRAAGLYFAGCTVWSDEGCVHGERLAGDLAAVRDLPRGEAARRKKRCAARPRECEGSGLLVEHGAGGVRRDPDAAVTLYGRACDAGGAEACVRRALLELRLGRGAAAAQGLEAACTAGSLRGCRLLGWTLERGVAGAPDPARAAELYRRACEAGDGSACAGAARRAERRREATALYAQACAAGYVRGCRDGERAPRDAVRAACTAGDPWGCIGLAEGDGEEPRQRFAHYVEACRLGLGRGCWAAQALGMELDPPLDLAPADELILTACRYGDGNELCEKWPEFVWR